MNIKKLLEEAKKADLKDFEEIVDAIGMDDSFLQEAEELAAIYPRKINSIRIQMMESIGTVVNEMTAFGNRTDSYPDSLRHFALKHYELVLRSALYMWSKTKDEIIKSEEDRAAGGAN